MANRKKQFVWIIRHAKATDLDPAAGYRADIARPLSDEGVMQATARKGDFAQFTIVGAAASPAIRTRQTASIIAGVPVSMVDLLPALLAPDSGGTNPSDGRRNIRDARHINFLFANVGYAPLSGYRISPTDIEVMDRYGHETWAKVRPYLRQKGEGHIVLVGHAVLSAQTMLSAVMEKARRKDRAALREPLLNASMGEVGGFMIEFVQDKPTAVHVLATEPGKGTGLPDHIFAEPIAAEPAEVAEEVREEASPPVSPPPPPPASPPPPPPPAEPPAKGANEE